MVSSADFDALSDVARARPGVIHPSSNGYAALWTSTCADTAIFWPTATETETRYGLIARDYRNERAALLNGTSTCRCTKNVFEHVADKNEVSIRTLRTAIAHDRVTAASS